LQWPAVDSLVILAFIPSLCRRGGLHQWTRKDKTETHPRHFRGIAPVDRPYADVSDAVDTVRQSTLLQLVGMSQWATDQDCRDSLRSVTARIEDLFGRIAELAKSGLLNPFFRIGLAEGEGPVLAEHRPLRLGFYPVAANPMHWGHILVALSAMVQVKLDKIIFVIAGRDRRKPSMTSEETRHHLGQSVIESFHPLFAYSPLALGTDLDGETNLGRLLNLNWQQPLEVYYVAGGDHYQRTTSSGEPDTIEKLERVAREIGNPHHKISAIFIDRESSAREHKKVDTFLDVHILPEIPFSFSSTAARKALCKDAFCVALVSLPYSCLLEIRTGGLYSGKGECVEELESPL
jgi:nicotinic acid mononucleotide adenylyltransferase